MAGRVSYGRNYYIISVSVGTCTHCSQRYRVNNHRACVHGGYCKASTYALCVRTERITMPCE